MSSEAYANDRAEYIERLRQWARDEIATGSPIEEVHRELIKAFDAVIQEFRVEFDVPGVRYWEHPESSSHFTTFYGSEMSMGMADHCVELARHEYMSRQGIYFGYGDRL